MAVILLSHRHGSAVPADEFERVPGVGQRLRIFAKVRTRGGHLHALVPAMGRKVKHHAMFLTRSARSWLRYGLVRQWRHVALTS